MPGARSNPSELVAAVCRLRRETDLSFVDIGRRLRTTPGRVAGICNRAGLCKKRPIGHKSRKYRPEMNAWETEPGKVRRESLHRVNSAHLVILRASGHRY